MKCPFCGNPDNQVIDTRDTEESAAIRRRRRCLNCNQRFSTVETPDLRLPAVVKNGGERAVFDEARLRRGLERALHKRPVPAEKIDSAIESIKHALLKSGEREISTREIGELAMQKLFALDQVAYIRFASVYKSFTGVEEFQKIIAELQPARHKEKL